MTLHPDFRRGSAAPTPTGRVFEHRRIWTLDTDTHAYACRRLAAATRELGQISTVIGIAHGGLFPSRIIADALGLAAHRITARHNATDAAFLPATGNVACDISTLPAALRTPDGLAGTVLLVDDICGTGATLDAVTTALTPWTTPGTRLLTATLCRNLGATRVPDLYCWDVADWVAFPWEPAPPHDAHLEGLSGPAEVILRG
ncbi:hypothetical protein FHR81_003214 [Actinoalloteichus hoggarensis]|uniref:Xanthine-guanine phosphoribosyltransferase n=1 Tax=Actinoalloteichus hoggarensis TaxID=1470176 RepID=A0A221W6H9_9PSEU|nr:phosphoribosyltransferase family protein [Actinoalloteichus hoggarensis]ASO21570.1 xanthine-guanine phosphoribosyltransferase [Actinoalloteichus hoggarensis]MBB5922162.1 hypothetical protein [Actinoalloteichus hoggarensis]